MSPKTAVDDVYPPFVGECAPPYEREGDIEYPFEDTTGAGDHNKARGNWGSNLDFILACLGFAVGLGNVFRFPYYVYINGGGAFLVPYTIMLFLAGLPVLFMELSLGQFSSLGCVGVWKLCPLFKGIGIAMFIVSCLIAIYYQMITGWAIYYLMSSVGLSLPWATCDNEWNSADCAIWTIDTYRDCQASNGSLVANGSCVTNSTSVEGITSMANRTLPSHEFFHNRMLQISPNIDVIGGIQWELVIALLAAWLLTFFCLFKGIKTSGKVVYVTTVAPYIILLVLLVRAITLPGATNGLYYFFMPRWEALLRPRVWGDAAVQIFFSLSSCWGGLITLASYNKFHNNCYRDMLIVGFGDALTSIYAGCVTFATLGFMAYNMDVSIDKVAVKGAGLAFVVYAEVISHLPIAPLWAVIFFAMIIMLGIDTQIFVIETIVTAVCDEFPERLRKNHRHVLSFVCVLFFGCGLLLCTQAGMYILQLMDYFAATWSLLIIAFCECLVVAWVYGADNLMDNIKWMTGSFPMPYIMWKLMWKFVSPIVIIGILTFVLSTYTPVTYGTTVLPEWANTAGWALSLVSVAAIPLTMLVQLTLASGPFSQRVQTLLSPHDEWGPALAVHRAEQYPLHVPEAQAVTKLPVDDDIHASDYSLVPDQDRETAI